MRLGKNDHIVGAWAEAPSGPGWSNRLVWICVRSAIDGAHRVEALQPDEQGPDIPLLFPVALAASVALMAAVERLTRPGSKPPRPRRSRGRESLRRLPRPAARR